MKSSIGVLPEEIQTYILSKLDGRSAAVSKRVCRLWKELITGLETCLHFWLRRCLKEIPAYTLVELTRLLQLSGGREVTLTELAKDWNSSLESKLPWMFWREVYAEFHRCCYINHGDEKRTQLYFFPLYGEVSCLHVQDNVIYSGHESGIVMSWTNIEEDLNCDIIYRHQKRVTCIAGLDMVTSTSNILNGELGCKLVSSSRDSTLMVHNVETEESTTIKHYTKQVNCVRCWNNQFVAAANGSMIQGQPIWTSKSLTGLESEISVTLLSQSASDLTAVAFWDDRVVSADELGNLFEWSDVLDDGQWIAGVSSQEMSHLVNLGSPVRALMMLGHRVVCYTADHNLHVSQKGDLCSYRCYNIFKALHKTPECVTVRGSLLAIGCHTGLVYLYLLPSDRDWDDLDLASPSRVIKTGTDHINAVVIGDDGGGPVVVIATEGYYITVVQFRRRKDQMIKKKCV